MSFDSRYGMWLDFSVKAEMTRPRVRRDWLIMPASLARLSVAPDRPIASDPAKSTRLNFPIRRRSSPPLAREDSLTWTVMEKMVCDRL